MAVRASAHDAAEARVAVLSDHLDAEVGKPADKARRVFAAALLLRWPEPYPRSRAPRCDQGRCGVNRPNLTLLACLLVAIPLSLIAGVMGANVGGRPGCLLCCSTPTYAPRQPVAVK